jgi:hypothetical protein
MLFAHEESRTERRRSSAARPPAIVDANEIGPRYEPLMVRVSPGALLSFLLAAGSGCAAEPRSPPAEVEVTVPAATASPLAASASATPSSFPSQGQAAVVDPCRRAFEDQLTLSVDIEVRDRGVHPGWEELFLTHCLTMPAHFQRCASPLYQIEHEAECNAVKSETGTPAKRQWSLTFEVLAGQESLDKPPVLSQ